MVYYKGKKAVDESEIMNRIHEIWLKFPAYGVKQRAILTPLGGKTASKIDPPAM